MVIRQQGDGGTEKQQMVQEICSCLANVIWWWCYDKGETGKHCVKKKPSLSVLDTWSGQSAVHRKGALEEG